VKTAVVPWHEESVLQFVHRETDNDLPVVAKRTADGVRRS